VSGHSKWSTIKHKKAIKDAKKGKIFSKVSQKLTLAARQGGGDSSLNPTLRIVIQEAKEAGFPSDSIQKAIDKGTGEKGGSSYQEITYEGYGIDGVGILIDVVTDNSNRTVADIRTILSDHNGRLADQGSVMWNFDVKGNIVVKSGKFVKSNKYGEDDRFEQIDPESVEMSIMDIGGVIDISEEDGVIEVATEFESLMSVRDRIMELGYVVLKAEVKKLPKNKKNLSEESKQKVENLIQVLEEHDDVQNIWTDVNY